MALKTVVELVDQIHEAGHGEPVRRRKAFEEIGRSPDSHTSRDLLAAANRGYHLVKGGKNATHLTLTEAGERIASSESDAERRKAQVGVLFSNEFFKSIVDQFSDRPFPDDALVVVEKPAEEDEHAGHSH